MLLCHWLHQVWMRMNRGAWRRRGDRVGRRWPLVLELQSLEERVVPSMTLKPTIFTDSAAAGSGSLRAAIAQANSDKGKGTDTIELAAGTYALTIQNAATGQENAATAATLKAAACSKTAAL
jgi:hypothetical protein